MKIFVLSLFLRMRVAIAEHGKCGRTIIAGTGHQNMKRFLIVKTIHVSHRL